jgi:hypothetical protein
MVFVPQGFVCPWEFSALKGVCDSDYVNVLREDMASILSIDGVQRLRAVPTVSLIASHLRAFISGSVYMK